MSMPSERDIASRIVGLANTARLFGKNEGLLNELETKVVTEEGWREVSRVRENLNSEEQAFEILKSRLLQDIHTVFLACQKKVDEALQETVGE